MCVVAFAQVISACTCFAMLQRSNTLVVELLEVTRSNYQFVKCLQDDAILKACQVALLGSDLVGAAMLHNDRVNQLDGPKVFLAPYLYQHVKVLFDLNHGVEHNGKFMHWPDLKPRHIIVDNYHNYVVQQALKMLRASYSIRINKRRTTTLLRIPCECDDVWVSCHANLQRNLLTEHNDFNIFDESEWSACWWKTLLNETVRLSGLRAKSE